MVLIKLRLILGVFICVLPHSNNVAASQTSPDESRDLGDTRIIGGSLVPINTYPWFAKPLLSNNGWAGCGGSLVSPEYVLTAAHCIINSRPIAKVQIGAFCNFAGNCGQASEIVSVVKITKHNQYDITGRMENDFALLKLAKKVTVTAPIKMDQGTISPNYPSGK